MARGGFLSDNDRTALERFPADISAEDLERCFELTIDYLPNLPPDPSLQVRSRFPHEMPPVTVGLDVSQTQLEVGFR